MTKSGSEMKKYESMRKPVLKQKAQINGTVNQK